MAKWMASGIFVLCITAVGCGGGPSASDLKNRYAQRRSAPDNDDLPAAKAKPTEDTKSAAAKDAAAKTAKAASTAAAIPTAAEVVPIAPKKDEASVAKAPVRQKLSVQERRARTIKNLEAIGNAIAAYTAKHGKLPPTAILDDDGEPMLSWRVAILPELGYQELYEKFRVSVPWYNVQNKALLTQMPAEYQSPERQDTKTNYLGVAGPGMALSDLGGMKLSAVKDGADNTMAVVEADDRLAQEWTQPVEFVPNPADPRDGLGILRQDGAFGVLASGRLVLVPRKHRPEQWLALFTPSGGEDIDTTSLPSPTESPVPASQPEVVIAAPAAPTAPKVAAKSASAMIDPPAAARPSPAVYPVHASPIHELTRTPVPDNAALATARTLLKEVYKAEYEKAQTADQRQAFVKKLLADAPKVTDSPHDYFELLRIARDVAASVGDVKSVLAATDLLVNRFQIDPLQTRLLALQELEKFAKWIDAPQAAQTEAVQLKQEAFEADRYDIAVPAQELALSFKRMEAGQEKTSSNQRNSKAELSRLAREVESLQDAKKQFEGVQQALAALKSDPSDQASSEVVGKYLCFVKNQWDAGIPFLSRGADIKLRVIALIDATPNRTPAESLSLGDQYWELAQRANEPQRRGLRLRAAHCYNLATQEAANSLEKIKATRRVVEVEEEYEKVTLQGISPARAKIERAHD